MTKTIYTFCNIKHAIDNHTIRAIDETGKCVGSWVSSNHSFGKADILRGIDVDYPNEVVWVDDPMNHPIVSERIRRWNARE
jgi:hypothetical protein